MKLIFACLAGVLLLHGCGDTTGLAGPMTHSNPIPVTDGGAGDPLYLHAGCTSDEFWTRGDHESPRMHPGAACIQCHTEGVAVEDENEIEHGPRFSVAGTVYATGHEPDDCNGVDGPLDEVFIEISDAAGRTYRLPVNDVGNFYREDPLVFPISARVSYQGRTRVMASPQNTGDCNSCHTEDGTDGAPGRIVLP